MGAVLGGRATVGKHCHIGAGTVLAGVIEPQVPHLWLLKRGCHWSECGRARRGSCW